MGAAPGRDGLASRSDDPSRHVWGPAEASSASAMGSRSGHATAVSTSSPSVMALTDTTAVIGVDPTAGRAGR